MRVLPVALPLALRLGAVRRLAFLTVSQTRISYRKGPLADGPSSGDRFPPYPDDGARPDRWRLVLPLALPEAASWCAARGIDLRVAPEVEGCWLVRPDGYVGRRLATFDAAALDRTLRERVGRPI